MIYYSDEEEETKQSDNGHLSEIEMQKLAQMAPRFLVSVAFILHTPESIKKERT